MPSLSGVLGQLRPLLTLAALLAVAACGSGGSGAQAARPPGAPASPQGPLTGTPPAGMAPIVDSVPLLWGVSLDTVRSVALDRGRMWTFELPPVDHLRETYAFVPDSVWLRHARLAALRIPGCSAAFVSASGLVLTAHHCAREALARVSLEGEDLLGDGFYARTLPDERAVEDFHADRLVAIHDVSEDMERRLALAPASLRAQRRAEIHAEIGQRIADEYGGEAEGIVVELVPHYGGALTSAYVYRRYDDVRLVMAPELQVGFFGGDPDNFTYPRHTLDYAFFRVYDGAGDPLASDSYFPWSAAGASEGEPAFAIGSPGPTQRRETFAQLMFRRDVSDRAVLDFLVRRTETFEEFVRDHPQLASELAPVLFGLRNSVKAYEGRLAGLHDPVVLARLRDRDRAMEAGIEADSVLSALYGGLIERMAELQDRKRENPAGYSFIALVSGEWEAATLHRAVLAYQYFTALRQAQPISVREELRSRILAIGNRPAELDETLIRDRLEGFVAAYGTDSELARAVLDGRSAEGAAAHIRQNSVFADSATTAEALAAGAVPPDDPALRVVQSYLPVLSRFEQIRTPLAQQEAVLAEQIGRALYALHGTTVPPDATSTLRISDGVVSGYPYNGTLAPPFTTFHGLYDRFHGHQDPGSMSAWALPERWRGPPAGLDLSTPVNFVLTADITGGSSGSPVVNRDLEVVGVVFDGNRESLSGSYLFLDARSRAVAVDARGILASLSAVYDMESLVAELTAGRAAGADAGVDGPGR